MRLTGIGTALMLCGALLLAGPACYGQEGAEVGVRERLGERLPLELAFRDETGRTVRLADLVTGPTIILPVYYRCTNVCYKLQWELARTLPRIKPQPGTDYRVVSFSFDATETPQLAARFKPVYLGAMHAPFPAGAWSMLTGDGQSIARLADAIGYGFQRRGGEFLHPVASVVVAGDGRIVRYLYGTDFLPKDLTLALAEARSGTGGGASRRVLEFCFSYDPQKRTYVFNLLRVSATVVLLSAGGLLAFLVFGGKKRRKT